MGKFKTVKEFLEEAKKKSVLHLKGKGMNY